MLFFHLIKPFRPENVLNRLCGSTPLLLLVTSSVLTIKAIYVRELKQGEEIFQSIPE